MPLSDVTGQVGSNSLTTGSASYCYESLEFVKYYPTAMNENKKPKVRSGRIYRIVKMPIGIHNHVKSVAKKRTLTVAELYDQIISDFLLEAKNTKKSVGYLFHQGDVKHVSIALKEAIVDDIKKLAIRDSVPETRIIFTAIMNSSEKNLLAGG